MKSVIRTISQCLALCAASASIGTMAMAETPATSFATMTCTRGDGSVVKEAVYAYNLGSGTSNPRYFTVYLANNKFNAWLYEEYFDTSGFGVCSFSNFSGTSFGDVTVADVTALGVGVDVDAGSLSEDGMKQFYTEITFSYTSLVIGASPVPTIPKASKEDQAKALAAYKAKAFPLLKR